jgi:hypothetical protein
LTSGHSRPPRNTVCRIVIIHLLPRPFIFAWFFALSASFVPGAITISMCFFQRSFFADRHRGGILPGLSLDWQPNFRPLLLPFQPQTSRCGSSCWRILVPRRRLLPISLHAFTPVTPELFFRYSLSLRLMANLRVSRMDASFRSSSWIFALVRLLLDPANLELVDC